MLHIFIYVFIQDNNDFLLSVDQHKIILLSLCGACYSLFLFNFWLCLMLQELTFFWYHSLSWRIAVLLFKILMNKILTGRKRRGKVAVIKSNKSLLHNPCTKRWSTLSKSLRTLFYSLIYLTKYIYIHINIYIPGFC